MNTSLFESRLTREPVKSSGTLELNVLSYMNKTRYRSVVTTQSKKFEINIIPVKSRNMSMLDDCGVASVEISPINSSGQTLYYATHSSVVKSRDNLSKQIAYELRAILVRFEIISRFDSLNIQFYENGAMRNIEAI